MSKVYITQQPMRRDRLTGDMVAMHDITPALEYGNLTYLCEPGPVWHAPKRLIHMLKRLLKDFNSEDHLLLLGDPVLMVATAMVAASQNNGSINVLKWDRQQMRYIAIKLEV